MAMSSDTVKDKIDSDRKYTKDYFDVEYKKKNKWMFASTTTQSKSIIGGSTEEMGHSKSLSRLDSKRR